MLLHFFLYFLFTHFLCSLQNFGSLEEHEASKVIHDKIKDAYSTVNGTEIDHTVKNFTDVLLHTLEGVSSRLAQLEDRTYDLEGAMDELKLCIGNRIGNTDGKLRQLENILREVSIFFI